MNKSPFSLLPHELISSIFLNCLPDNPSFRSHDAPLLLTHVCRSWRIITEETPRLWSHIVVPRWQQAPVGVDELAKLWIDNSRNAPLTIDLGLVDQDVRMLTDPQRSDELRTLLLKILELLAPHRARIYSLWGVFPPSLNTDYIGISEMGNVERVFFYGLPGARGENIGHHPHTKLDIGSPKRSLRVLSVCDCAVDIGSVIQQDQLTHLELFDLHRSTSICQETAFKLLQALPNLTKCVFELTRFERLDWTAPRQRLVLETLELLFLLWSFPADIGILLDSISTPKLIRLGLRGTPTLGPQAWNGLFDFLRASRAPLTRVSLGNLGDANIRLLDCLKCCPRIAHLSLNHSVVPEEVVRALTCTDEAWDAQLLPCLTTLNLVACAGLKVDAISAFLKSRTQDLPSGFSQLREVEVINCLYITEEHVAVLQECGVEKLTVKVNRDYLV